MYDIKTQKIKTFHEKVGKIFEISWKKLLILIFILFFFTRNNTMTNITIQNTNLNLKLVKFNDEEQQAVNARDLHKFLGSKQDFSTWIKARIQKYGFIENEDFIVDKENTQIHDKINSPKRATATDGGFEKATAKPLVKSAPQIYGTMDRAIPMGFSKIDYYISLDMAKELAMIENNKKGREVRKYFIQCEKLLKQKIAEEQQTQLIKQSKKLLALENKLQDAQIKACQFDALVAQSGFLNFRKVAKELELNERSLKSWLIQNDWISLRGSQKKMSPKSWTIRKKYMVFKHQLTESGDISTYPMALFSYKGIKEIQRRLMTLGLHAQRGLF